MHTLLLTGISVASAFAPFPRTSDGWYDGTAAPDLAGVTAIVPYAHPTLGDGHAAFVDETNVLYFLPGDPTSTGWTVLTTIEEDGRGLALAVHDGTLYVGGHFWSERSSASGPFGTVEYRAFSLGVFNPEPAGVIPLVAPCEGTETGCSGVVEALLAVEGEGPLAGLWAGGTGLFDGSALSPVVRVFGAGGAVVDPADGLGAGPDGASPLSAGHITAYALAVGVDPAATDGRKVLFATGQFVEEGTFGIALYDPSATRPPAAPAEDADADLDHWYPVGGGFSWSGSCPSSGGFSAGCTDRPGRALAFFQGLVYVAGDFPADTTGLALGGFARWDGSAWAGVAGVSPGAAPFAPVDDGYTRLAADGDTALYIGTLAETFETAPPSVGVVGWDGVSAFSVGGGVHLVSETLGIAEPGWVRSLLPTPAGALIVGGTFTAAGVVPDGAPLSTLDLAAASGLGVWSAASTCPTDLDDSGDTAAPDLALLLAGWGTPDGDINADGTTDAADLAALLDAWGACP